LIGMRGAGVPRDAERGVEFFERAAQQGHIPAQLALARCCAFNAGIVLDEMQAQHWDTQAEHWYTQALWQGEPSAALPLARLYKFGKRWDPFRAKHFYTVAAESFCDPAAQFELGEWMYADEYDMPRALDLIRRAAAQGHCYAQASPQ
jgi:TPR repeat protein